MDNRHLVISVILIAVFCTRFDKIKSRTQVVIRYVTEPFRNIHGVNQSNFDYNLCGFGNYGRIQGQARTCHACDTYDGSDCIEPSSSMPTRVCLNPLDTCSVVAVEGAETARGCTSELSSDYNCNLAGRHCFQCSENLCNSLIFPPDRSRCYQCSGQNCGANLVPESDRFGLCLSFNTTEQCFTYADGAGIVHRGCGSDISLAATACRVFGNCEFCDASQIRCNNQPTHRAPTTSCATCNDNQECAWRLETTSSAPCIEPVVFPYNESCFTHVGVGVVERGCTNERRSLCSLNQCDQCTGNGCNTASTRSHACVVCASDIDGQEYCGDNSVIAPQEECGAQGGLSFGERGCFISNEGGVISRGCLTSLPTSNRTTCLSEDNEHCRFCEVSGCNIGIAPTGGAATLTSYTILITLIYICIRQILV